MQTLARPLRLDRLAAYEHDLIVTDEARHAVAATYQAVYERFDAGKRVLHLGMTATPGRADGQGLGRVFREVVYEDFDDRSLEAVLNARNRNELIRHAVLRLARGSRVLGFAAGVAHAHALAAVLKEGGVRAEAVDGETPYPLRRESWALSGSGRLRRWHVRLKIARELALTHVPVETWDVDPSGPST